MKPEDDDDDDAEDELDGLDADVEAYLDAVEKHARAWWALIDDPLNPAAQVAVNPLMLKVVELGDAGFAKYGRIWAYRVYDAKQVRLSDPAGRRTAS